MLGLQHEQQHQELLLTDIQHLFAQNPLQPTLWESSATMPAPMPGPIVWVEGQCGPAWLGHDNGGFAFDCEGPRHETMLARHALAHRPVTNGEWMEFIADGGYADHRHRSEEQTSELQSLMRISYAVFCLKKKNNQTPHTRN